jgi:hypothetical protein
MNSTKSILAVGLVVYLAFFQIVGISLAQAEEDSKYNGLQTASQYYLERGTESKLMMKVNVWGAVQEPGSQYVPDGIDLISVLSAAGGPADGAKLSKVRLIRNFNGEKQNTLIDLSRCLKRGEVETLPEIKPGDTIIVPKSRVSLGKFVGVVYHIAVIASVVKLMTD